MRNALAIASVRDFVQTSKTITPVTGTHVLKGVPKPVKGFIKKWERTGAAATTLTENFHRSAAFVKGLEDAAGDPMAARAFTMMRHGDYDELTDMEHRLKGILPFYKWVRTNRAYQLRNLVESMVVLAPQDEIGATDIPRDIRERAAGNRQACARGKHLLEERAPRDLVSGSLSQLPSRHVLHWRRLGSQVSSVRALLLM